MRGLSVLLIERFDFTHGATGRNHGLLHSGARYAVTDQESATECIVENKILRRIAPHCVEEHDGLFITLPEDDLAFLRTNIEIIDRFFAEDEVQEIWLTFSDPQMKNPRKRLTSTYFMNRYRHFLVDGGIIHLKTDSNFLFTYTTYMVDGNHLPVLFRTEDLYHQEGIDEETRKILSIQTYYESMWIERGLNIKYQKFALPP